jgi:hypothetical protein
MKFRNVTDDALRVESLGVTVEPGCQTPDLDRAQAAGFAQQSDKWCAVKAPVKAAAKKPPAAKPSTTEVKE